MLTIHAEDPMGVITNGVTMRVRVPTDWACRFDAGASITYGGNAAGKAAAASFSDDGRELQIPLTADFAADDTLTLSGLSLLYRQVSARSAAAGAGFHGGRRTGCF